MRKVEINLKCQHCGTMFTRPPSLARRAMYCGKACADAAQTGERRTVDCEECGEPFLSKKDHGVWQKFCCRSCFEAGSVKPEWKECPSCGGQFLATRSSHIEGTRKYCSDKCRHEGNRKEGAVRTCVNCGTQFELKPSAARQRKEDGCCSLKCRREFYRESRSPAWKGGKYVNVVCGEVRVRLPRPKFVSPYIGEHRIVASRAIGRLLEPHEKILHINNVPDDNRPENLFICGTNSETVRRVSGALPWPKESNLSKYK